MILNDKIYNILKWVVMIVLPASATLYGALGSVWALPYVDQICQTIIAIDTFLGAVLGISSVNYKKLNK